MNWEEKMRKEIDESDYIENPLYKKEYINIWEEYAEFLRMPHNVSRVTPTHIGFEDAVIIEQICEALEDLGCSELETYVDLGVLQAQREYSTIRYFLMMEIYGVISCKYQGKGAELWIGNLETDGDSFWRGVAEEEYRRFKGLQSVSYIG